MNHGILPFYSTQKDAKNYNLVSIDVLYFVNMFKTTTFHVCVFSASKKGRYTFIKKHNYIIRTLELERERAGRDNLPGEAPCPAEDGMLLPSPSAPPPPSTKLVTCLSLTKVLQPLFLHLPI